MRKSVFSRKQSSPVRFFSKAGLVLGRILAACTASALLAGLIFFAGAGMSAGPFSAAGTGMQVGLFSAAGTGMSAGPFSVIRAHAESVVVLEEEEYGYVYEDQETGFVVLLRDDADLLSDEEEAKLLEDMIPLTAYGNVGFVTSRTYSGFRDTEDYASSLFYESFGYESGAMFVIDLFERVLAIHTDGRIEDSVGSNEADNITANVYRKASAGDYYEVARDVYAQIGRLVRGERIAQPMKYITNAILAVILALLLNYLFLRRYAAAHKPSREELL